MTYTDPAVGEATSITLAEGLPVVRADRLKAAVIGCGVISEQHLRFLRSSAIADLVAVCDLSPILGKTMAERFGAARAYTELEELLTVERPEVVHILTPPHTHIPLAKACLAAGAHVLVEKPIALTCNDYLDLAAYARSVSRHVTENHNYKFNRPINIIRSLLQSGHLGKVEEIEVRMALSIRDGAEGFSDPNLVHPSHNLPGGVIHEFLTHLCYLFLEFLPAERKSDLDVVVAQWENHGGGNVYRFDDLDAVLTAGTVHGRLRFSARTAPDCFRVLVHGSSGYAEAELFQPWVVVNRPRAVGKLLSPIANQIIGGMGLALAGVQNFGAKIMQHTPYEGLFQYLEHTYAAIREGRALPVQHETIVETLRLVDELIAQQP